MKTHLTALCVVVCSTLATSAHAADARACDAFVAAFGKAGKLVTGKALAAEDVGFWKKQCAKKADADVKKDTACFEKAKTKDDVGACMK
jgi:hypothetical protein